MAAAVRALRFLPLAFLANIDGFVLFGPYMIATVGVAHILWAAKRRRAAAATRDAGPGAVEETPELVPAMG